MYVQMAPMYKVEKRQVLVEVSTVYNTAPGSAQEVRNVALSYYTRILNKFQAVQILQTVNHSI